MKEELIRVLNNKLNDINDDIDSLIELNKKINEEKENLSYVSSILALFDDNGEQNVLNFAKVSKEDFEKVLSIVSAETKDIFNTNDCNYDGLVYLINGINDGVLLSLTDEQTNGIKYLIDQLGSKVNEYSAALDGYELVKTRYEINDLDELNRKKDHYTEVIDNLNNNEYVCDTDLIMEAAGFSDISQDIIVEMLTYILEYNTIIYNSRPHDEAKEGVVEQAVEEHEEPITYENEVLENVNNNEIEIEEAVEPVEEIVEEQVEKEEPKEEYNSSLESNIDEVFHFNDISSSNINDTDVVTFDAPAVEEKEEDVFNIPYTPIVDEEEKQDKETPVEEINNEYEEINTYDNTVDLSNLAEENIESAEESEAKFEDTDASIDNDFKDVIDVKEDYDDDKESDNDEKTSTRELQKLFDKYGLKENNNCLNELVTGNINNYDEILKVLKERDIINKIEKNSELLVEVLLDSNTDVINNVLNIIERDLSVDNEDFAITTKIAINTIPSVFVKDGGNYDNFVKNVDTFKQIGLNLINLFDFSKEIFVADNEKILKNLDIVKGYGYEINHRNAKYMLLLPNIGDRIDYYVESIYEDKLKDETFDGAEYIKDYAAKLNVVTDETIKRIRYASENGKKVFGSKPKSLSGEITNLKVNALDISSDYLNKFFNNEFASLTGDEVREYIKLIHNSSNVGNYDDELEKLKSYLKGLRYEIDGVRVSANKVKRNYNILRSYGIDSSKALEFAVCYNLVITKEEYGKLKSKLDELGGNL